MQLYFYGSMSCYDTRVSDLPLMVTTMVKVWLISTTLRDYSEVEDSSYSYVIPG
jgi:hypothetical protein